MKIAVVGSYGVGLTMYASRFPRAGETLTGGEFVMEHGGKGSNQAVGAARLGAEVAFLTAIGCDSYGVGGRRMWDEEDVDARHVKEVEQSTMVGVIIVDGTGENRIIIAPGALGHLDRADVDTFRARLAEADVALVSLEIPLDTAWAALRVAKEQGTTTLLNPAPALALPSEIWESVDVVTPNVTEASVITGIDERLPAIEIATRLRDRTGSAVVMTLGGDGAMVCDDGEPVLISPVRVPRVVDTTGAGDSFNAALAVGLAEGMLLTEAARFASHAGAHTVGRAGVIPALPTRHDLEAIGFRP